MKYCNTKSFLSVWMCLLCLASLDVSYVYSSSSSSSLYVFGNCSRHACRRCGTKPYPSNTGSQTPDPIATGLDVWSFVSEPELHPMKISVITQTANLSNELVFVAPYAFSDGSCVGQQGSLMLDIEGNPYWFRPTNTPNLMNTDFRVQYLKGKKCLHFGRGLL